MIDHMIAEFRYRSIGFPNSRGPVPEPPADRSVAVEGLRATFQQRKATRTPLGAKAGGGLKIMQPYLEALTAHELF